MATSARWCLRAKFNRPQEVVIRADLTTAEMVEVGRGITEGKGLCRTCHTIGQTGALRFPDFAGVAGRAAERVPGLSDVEYFAQSMYEPDTFVVPGFNPGMPAINRPPIGLTDQEILCVIAYLQSLGGTPTVTLQTSHRYYAAPAAPGAAPAAPGAAPPAGAPTAAPGALLPPGARAGSRQRHQRKERLHDEHPGRRRRCCRVRVPPPPSGQSAVVGRRLVGGNLRPAPIRIHDPDSRFRHLDLHGNRLDRDPGVPVLQRRTP